MKIASTVVCLLASTTTAFHPQKRTTTPPKSQSAIRMDGSGVAELSVIPTLVMVSAVAVSVAVSLKDQDEEESRDVVPAVTARASTVRKSSVQYTKNFKTPETVAKTSPVQYIKGVKTPATVAPQITFSATPAVPAPATVEAVQEDIIGAETKAVEEVAKRIKVNDVAGNAISFVKALCFPWVGMIPGMKS
jgi:hypothetical protein